MQIINNNLDSVDKVRAIRARIERMRDAEAEDGDRHTRNPGFTIEDIEKILNGEDPDR